MSKTSRELRCEVQYYKLDSDKKRDVLKFEDGTIRKNVVVSGNDLTFTFSRNGEGCYPDDALAVIRDILHSFENKDDHTLKAIQHVQAAIQVLDQRALKRHGYSGSKEEQDFKPSYLNE
jgi:hypothetical protein